MNPHDLEGLVHAAESGLSPYLLALAIVLGTFVSEDLTCIVAGLLVARGVIGFVPAALASTIGVYLGDVLLYLAGRYLAGPLRRLPLLRRVLTPAKLEASEDWFRRRGPIVILISRFVPGSRLTVYVGSGMLRMPFRSMFLVFAVAALLWTPLLVGLSAAIGGPVIAQLETYGRLARWLAVALALGLWGFVRLALPLFSFRGRRLLVGRLKRLRHWEFWPQWACYLPLVPYLLRLMLRHRSVALFTAANPGIPGGGFLGESKAAILDNLRHAGDCVARHAVIEPDADPARRVAQYAAARSALALAYPVVLKPDQGQRGEGVGIIRSDAQAADYLARTRQRVVLQEYVPGQEFGVFYVREPHEAQGRIFSVTEKRMPVLVGDGRHTLAGLIYRDARAVCMADWYLRCNRARANEVVPAGEPVQLVELGTHCRGAIFLDGRRVLTPAFAAAIDRISRGFPGFHFGRYDIRTPNVADLQCGRNFKIVELNGVTSEATHIYDPANSLAAAHRVLREQWRLAFAIGAACRDRGAVPLSAAALWRTYRAFQRAPEAG